MQDLREEGAVKDIPTDTFMTVPEIARALRVSRMTVYRLVEAGTLPSVRVGRSIRVPRSAYDAYLQSRWAS